jgi:multidrug resistance efflux pump
VIALIALFAIASVVPMNQTVTGPCRVESAATWYLSRNGAGQIATGWQRNYLHVSGGGLMLQFQRPDFVEVNIADGIRQGGKVNAGDTVAWIESREGKGRLQVIEAERDMTRSKLEGLVAGAREADVRVAEHDYERASAALEIARIDLERAISLHDSGYATLAEKQYAESVFDERKAECDQAKANIAALKEGSRLEDIEAGEAEVVMLEKSVEAARLTLGKREAVITPVSGIVNLNEGANGELIRIERTDTVAVITRIPEASLSLITEGHPMEMRLEADPHGPRPVTIVDFGFSITPGLPGAFAIGLLQNPNGDLRAGMSGKASCAIGRRTLLQGTKARLGSLRF